MAAHEKYVTVTQGGSGWMAVLVWWNADLKCSEPFDTGMGRYATEAEAADEGREWADCEGVAFFGSDESALSAREQKTGER